MAQSSSGGPLIAAAVILGGALVGASFLLSKSIDRGTETLSKLGGSLESAVAARDAGRPAAPTRARRPDPSKVYNVEVGSAPVKGPKSAAVTVVEWADFQ